MFVFVKNALYLAMFRSNIMIGIYKITSPSGKVYIGQSRNIEKRWHSYKKLHCKRQTKLYNSFLKHGVENHTFEIIEECVFEKLNERERYWQDYYDVMNIDKGLNLVLQSSFQSPRIESKETRSKRYKGNHPLARKVIDTSTGKIYDYMKQCAEDIGIGRCMLQQMLIGRRENKTSIRYLNPKNTNKPKSNTYIIAENKKTKEVIIETIDDISLIFELSRDTILNRINTLNINSYKHKDWSFKYRDKDVEKSNKIKSSSRNKNIILDLNTGVYYYGYTDLAKIKGLINNESSKSYISNMTTRVKNNILSNKWSEYKII